MPQNEEEKSSDLRKEDFISKFQINEIVPLLRISEKYNVDISEGKKLLVKALHVARTTRNLDEIVHFLEGSKKEIELSLQAHFIRWHAFLKMDLDKKKDIITADSTLPHLMETARVFTVDKNYETAATLLGRCEVELLKLVAPPLQAKPSQPDVVIKPEPKIEPKPEPRQEPKYEPAPVLKPEPKREPVQDYKPQPEIEDKPFFKSEPEQEKEPVAKTEPQPETSPARKPDSIIDSKPELKPEQADKKDTYQKVEVKELAKCGLCMGKIKPGAIAIECACGIYYHEQCGKRAGKCPNCGVSFEG